MAEAVASGADLVGGLDPAGFDWSIEGHLDVVFGIAERRGVGIDIHLHDPDMLGIFELEEIARRTKALGMAGHVTVSHAYALGQGATHIPKRVPHALAAAGGAILANAPGDPPLPPIRPLRSAAAPMCSVNHTIPPS